MSAVRVSAVLITLNAESHLDECLRSLAWADEIVVVDGGSTDATTAICARHGARVITQRDWLGFGPQKNLALSHAQGEWVLSLDADEICTPELRAEIESVLRQPAHPAYEMPRLSSFCGHWIHHGGWWPDHVTRLFRRDAARFSDDAVHERVIVGGSTGRLKAHLLHYTYDTYAQALQKAERYSTDGARQAFARGKRAGAFAAALRGGWTFIRCYLLRRGFLDGAAGWRLARYNAHTTRLKYQKLAALSRAT